jgi:hypothetical protein
MSTISAAPKHSRWTAIPSSVRQDLNEKDKWLTKATWCFVTLGILLRILRYAMNYPLWWDEAFVAVNFIHRDFVDLLKPLDYGQVCPILFLWCELAIVKLLGFSEWSLRLFPLACAIASVVLFHHTTGQIVQGIPLLLGVAIFATSFHPIVHAADLKPYASDLLTAMVLLAIVVEWRQKPDRTRWIWVLATVSPLMLALSHPAIFIATGIVLALLPAVLKMKRRAVWIAYIAFVSSTISAFTALYLVYTRGQTAAHLSAMQTQWSEAFPPLNDPLGLIRWLARAHTGSTFAYPCGGENGASSVSLLLFIVGVVALWRRDRTLIVMSCLAPFVVAMIAAAMRRYPYGGPVPHGSPARVMQYLAPSICLLTGVGAAVLLLRWCNRQRLQKVTYAVLIGLALVGIIPVASDVFHPYRSVHAQRAREFALRFWPEVSRDSHPICLRWDLGVGEWNSINLNVAVYLCNQMIYAPHRRQPQELYAEGVSVGRPLRCICPLLDPADGRVTAWLNEMIKDYQLKGFHQLAVNMAEPGASARMEYYYLYDFMPSASAQPLEFQTALGTVEPAILRSSK